MTVILDTSGTPATDRAELVRMTIAETIVPVEIAFAEYEATRVRGAITDFGRLTVCSVSSNAVTVERTPHLSHDDLPPSIFLGLQMAGSSLIVQGDREAVLRPGDLAFSKSTSPSRWSTTRASASTSSGCRWMRWGCRSMGGEAVDRAGIELVRALISVHAQAIAPAGDSLRTTLALRTLEYARAHLGDPELSGPRIAAALHVSPRHLYGVLADSGVSLAEWIRTHRLEACRIELARPESSSGTIGSVARRWGFTDASSFGRQFRAA